MIIGNSPRSLLKASLHFLAPLSGPVWPGRKALSPFLTGRMFVRRTYFGHFDEL